MHLLHFPSCAWTLNQWICILVPWEFFHCESSRFNLFLSFFSLFMPYFLLVVNSWVFWSCVLNIFPIMCPLPHPVPLYLSTLGALEELFKWISCVFIRLPCLCALPTSIPSRHSLSCFLESFSFVCNWENPHCASKWLFTFYAWNCYHCLSLSSIWTS